MLPEKKAVYLKKISNLLLSERTFTVTYCSNLENIEISSSSKNKMIPEKFNKLTLTLGDTLKTNASRVEIRDNYGCVFRLGPNSTFELEKIKKRIFPVYYGTVYKYRNLLVYARCGSKYRTSCWVYCDKSVFITTLDNNKDKFFAFSPHVDIYEYDEEDKKFKICSINEGYSRVLTYCANERMRNRYLFSDQQKISDSEFEYITAQFINPSLWISH
ncbi:MAG TPA: hypothetical protein PK845_07775 [Petrotogaceae bacterium]|nr:hypothetical protein [Petrotogaceae bacterium]